MRAYTVREHARARGTLCALQVEAEERVHGTKKVVAHHTPEFDIHEGALWCGAAMWVELASSILK